MITGQLKSDIDRIWDAFWSGGISNPLEVIEQITYLLFIKRLDELHTLEEKKANRLNRKIENPIFPPGAKGSRLRWSHFKNFDPQEMFDIVSTEVFPFIKDLKSDVENSTYSHHMKDARFTIPKPGLLAKAVELIDQIPMEDRDTKGDVYEYMLSKIQTAGQNGQFRTPRHITKLMVDLVEPKPTDVICDPASGTAGFLIAAAEYLRNNCSDDLANANVLKHFNDKMFHGFDFDSTMLRIGSMNMLLHGVGNPIIKYKDSLSEENSADEEQYSLVLANPPFSGSLDYESTAKDLLRIVRTKKTELLFLALFFRLLKPGGRAAVIVPSGVLESESNAHRTIRKALLEENHLEGIISLPHWVFKPYASVATAILLFGKGGETENVWFYRLENDGFNNDAIKSPRSGSELPKVLTLWKQRKDSSYKPSSGKHRFVTKEEIIENDYDLCDRVYLSGYEYPEGIPLRPLSELFEIQKGTVGAAQATGGEYPCITTSEEPKWHTEWTYDGEAICIPTVSSTGHGHASIKRIQYISGKFSAATITCVLSKKTDMDFYVPYVYYYLFVHKDELLVPLMRGSANVSLSDKRLAKLKIPMPNTIQEQKRLVSELEKAKQKIDELKNNLDSAVTVLDEKFVELRNSF